MSYNFCKHGGSNMAVPDKSHTVEEMGVVAYFVCWLCGTVSGDTLVDALLAGDRHLRADGVIRYNGWIIIVEYDGGYWHDEENRRRDLAKTNRLLAVYANAIVVRLRQGNAVQLPELYGMVRCVVVHVKTPSPRVALAEAAEALCAAHPEIYWPPVHAGVRPECDAAVEVVRTRMDHARADALTKLTAAYGSSAADTIIKYCCVVASVDRVIAGIERMTERFGITPVTLLRCVSDCMTSALSSEDAVVDQLMVDLEIFTARCGITDGKLFARCMCGSLFAMITDGKIAQLMTDLDMFQSSCGITDSKLLARVMGNSLVAAIAAGKVGQLITDINTFRSGCGITTGDMIVRCMSGSLVAAIAAGKIDVIMTDIKTFQAGFGITNGKMIAQCMCGSLAAAIAGGKIGLIMIGLETFKSGCGITTVKMLVSLISSSLVAAIASGKIDRLMNDINTFKAGCGITNDKMIARCMGGSLISAIAAGKIDHLMADIATFKRRCGITNGKMIAQCMCNSLVAAIAGGKTDRLMMDFETLKKGCGIADGQMCAKIMCSSLISAVAGGKIERLMGNIRKFSEYFSIDKGESLASCLGRDSLAAALAGDDADTLFAGVTAWIWSGVPLECLPSLLTNCVVSAFMDRADAWLEDFATMSCGIGLDLVLDTFSDGVASRLGKGSGFTEDVIELHALLIRAGMHPEFKKFVNRSPHVGYIGDILGALRGLEGISLRDAIISYATDTYATRRRGATSARKKTKI
jgi:hypothetical protein